MKKASARPVIAAQEATKSVAKAVYFGLADQQLINVTASVIGQCANDASGTWQMPADDAERASLFGDPIPNVLKKVYVRALAADGKSFSETVILSSDACRFDYVDGGLSFDVVDGIDFGRLYAEGCENPSDIDEHLPTLYRYAKSCGHITEMGVRTGSSTRAFLYAAPERLVSYDLYLDAVVGTWFDQAQSLGFNYNYIAGNTLNIRIEKTDLLFIDTLHNYHQLKSELELHAASVARYIVFHDTESFGEKGESYSGELGIKGIRFAIDEFLEASPEWRMIHEAKNCNGLIVIERLSQAH
jgi:hypothetical protein